VGHWIVDELTMTRGPKPRLVVAVVCSLPSPNAVAAAIGTRGADTMIKPDRIGHVGYPA
jgi:hypothetical protein